MLNLVRRYITEDEPFDGVRGKVSIVYEFWG